MKRRLLFQIEVPADVTAAEDESQQEADDETGLIVLDILATALWAHSRFKNAVVRYVDSAEPIS